MGTFNKHRAMTRLTRAMSNQTGDPFSILLFQHISRPHLHLVAKPIIQIHLNDPFEKNDSDAFQDRHKLPNTRTCLGIASGLGKEVCLKCFLQIKILFFEMCVCVNGSSKINQPSYRISNSRRHCSLLSDCFDQK